MTRHSSFILRRLRRSESGAAILEFALTAPVFLMLLMGIFDFSWQLYAQQVLQGAVSQSARMATLEGYANDQTALDTMVRNKVKQVYPAATVTFSRNAYQSFDQVGKPEPLTDKNGNGRWDSGECFEDLNGTGSWEADSSVAGNGGADSVVLYAARMRFDRILPLWKMLGQDQMTTLTATTVLRNQPYTTGSAKREVICDK